MLESLASHLDSFIAAAPVWGYALVFFFMAVESSFIPFPSEIVMIPAGFLAVTGQLTLRSAVGDSALALLIGTLGSLVGALVNYWIGYKLGRPVLHRYGKYFFLKEKTLDRAEELFREYGDMTTFVCRLLPGIRQLISIPAGLARMKFRRFCAFTSLGAGFWNLVLLAVGIWLGVAMKSNVMDGDRLDGLKLVTEGKRLVSEHYIWILLGLAVFVAAYVALQRKVMKSRRSKSSTPTEA